MSLLCEKKLNADVIVGICTKVKDQLKSCGSLELEPDLMCFRFGPGPVCSSRADNYYTGR